MPASPLRLAAAVRKEGELSPLSRIAELPLGPGPRVAAYRPAFGRASVAGLVAALAAALAWAALTLAFREKFGPLALGVGLIVGLTVRWAGHGSTLRFAVLGASMALLGCLMGAVLSGFAFFALRNSVPYSTTILGARPSLAIDILAATFTPMDPILYAIAIYAGFRFSQFPIE